MGGGGLPLRLPCMWKGPESRKPRAANAPCCLRKGGAQARWARVVRWCCGGCGGVWWCVVKSTTHATDKPATKKNKTRVDDDEHDGGQESKAGRPVATRNQSGREQQTALLLCVFADLMQEAPTAPRSRALIGWFASSMTTHPAVGGQRHHIAKARYNKHTPRCFACSFDAMRLLLLVRANSLCVSRVVLVGALGLLGGVGCFVHAIHPPIHPPTPTHPKPQHDTRTHCTHTQPLALLVGDGPSRERAPFAPAWPSHDCPAANAH